MEAQSFQTATHKAQTVTLGGWLLQYSRKSSLHHYYSKCLTTVHFLLSMDTNRAWTLGPESEFKSQLCHHLLCDPSKLGNFSVPELLRL